MGPCGSCGAVFSFNPEKVPSFHFRTEKEPICFNCMANINAKRREAFLDPFPVLAGAYDAEEVL
jgi:hypothetical protein